MRALLDRRPAQPSRRSQERPWERGQSLVEFGLVLPIMLFLFLGIADLGRVFAASVVIEAATRDAAEIGANQYLSDAPGTAGLDQPVAGATTAEYDAIHLAAAKGVCAEMSSLPNSNVSGGDCAGAPIVRVCVHDGVDPSCGGDVYGSSIPSGCNQGSSAMTNAQAGSPQRWVEVRTCYRFSTLMNVPLFSFGDIWLERTRTFVIPCYFVIGTGACG